MIIKNIQKVRKMKKLLEKQNKIFRLKNRGGGSMKKNWKENKGKDRIGFCNSIARGISNNKLIKIFLPALILMLNIAVALNFLFKNFKGLINIKQLIINSERFTERALTTMSFVFNLIKPIALIIVLITLAAIPITLAETISHPASHIIAGTFDTGNFTFQNYLFINESLGIGTTSPSQILSVYGDAILEGTSRYLNFGTAINSSGYGIRDNTGTMEFKNNVGAWAGIASATSGGGWTDGGTSVYLTTGTDNVGIGTPSPSYKLHIKGTDDIATFDDVQIKLYSPVSFENTGDTSIAGDIVLTGASSNIIESYAPFYIKTSDGLAKDIILQPGGYGEVGIQNNASITGSLTIGSGTPGTVDRASGSGADLYLTDDLEVDGILYGNGSGLTDIVITLEGDLVTTSPITGAANDIFPGTGTKATIAINNASTSQIGAVQLENSTSSTSITKAATPYSVKAAYDLASGKDNYGDWDLYVDGSEKKSVTSAADVGFDSGTGINVSWDASRDVGFSFDCSDVEGNGIICDGESILFDCSDVEGNGIICDGENISFDCSDVRGNGLSCNGENIEHNDSSSQSSSNNSGRTYIQDVLLDTYGHITGLTTATESSLMAESDTLQTVTGRGPTTTYAVTLDSDGDGLTTIGGNLTVDSGTLFVDSAGNNVGIGTTSPAYPLHIEAGAPRALVAGTTAGSNVGWKLRANSSNGTTRDSGLYFISGDTDATTYLGLSADDTDYQLVTTREGNVGIGTTSPTAILHIKGTDDIATFDDVQIKFYSPVSFENTGDTSIAGDIVLTGASSNIIESYAPFYIKTSGGLAKDIILQPGGGGEVGVQGNLSVTDSVFLAANGYLNFGSTDGDSGYGLKDDSGTIQYKNSGGSWANIGSGSGGGYWNQTGNDIYYNDGNVGIGDTTPTEDKLVVNGGIKFNSTNYIHSGGDVIIRLGA